MFDDASIGEVRGGVQVREDGSLDAVKVDEQVLR